MENELSWFYAGCAVVEDSTDSDLDYCGRVLAHPEG
jgi:hypothetical protein